MRIPRSEAHINPSARYQFRVDRWAGWKPVSVTDLDPVIGTRGNLANERLDQVDCRAGGLFRIYVAAEVGLQLAELLESTGPAEANRGLSRAWVRRLSAALPIFLRVSSRRPWLLSMRPRSNSSWPCPMPGRAAERWHYHIGARLMREFTGEGTIHRQTCFQEHPARAERLARL
jgi:hypothetical protein